MHFTKLFILASALLSAAAALPVAGIEDDLYVPLALFYFVRRK